MTHIFLVDVYCLVVLIITEDLKSTTIALIFLLT